MRNIILLLVFISSIVSAQNADALFADANNLYKEGKYEEAITLYKQIENTKAVSSELYYNLGNAYYKLNKVAPSIYNYEKALILNPLNEDAKNNLLIAQKLTLDRIEGLPKTLFQKLNTNFLEKLHYNTWGYLAVIFSIIGSILFLAFYLSFNSTKKRVFFLALIFVLVVAYQQYNSAINKKEAIIFATEVNVKNAPTINSDEIFTLHEGTKVLVLDTVDSWKKIKLIDGKIGWLQTNTIQIIQIF